ncbi:YbhB/YbcL family Raf kinase inhibitor-like protein [Rhizobium sp. KVB221]|uniref:YbhB/YbcL family Raf kinase inhibitor-like protein n=1 Tax=Rhizobium setariae TaxID=2801340 RepID=A0A936YUW1_9HYPH|nr:YbhB/YbcL family Raf kinase inhibitor-like protein [Rhizobium setariae]MBL0373140.1 YbhB/YbcL family Raf kinase inhibitor-like protein [Rhizobium setariae]
MKRYLIAAAMIALAGAAEAGDFQVTSPEFASGTLPQAQFADKMGCTGGNVSPEIRWSGAPEGTKSFVVTMYDKDAPTGSGWWHWVVVDIPADATSIPAGAGTDAAKLPKGAHMTETDMREVAYLGACPPAGPAHEYKITVKALKVEKLEIPENASPALVGFMSNMNKLAEATIVAKGGR